VGLNPPGYFIEESEMINVCYFRALFYIISTIFIVVQSQVSYACVMIIGNGQVVNVNEGSSTNLIFGVKNTGPGPLTFDSYSNNLSKMLITGTDSTDDFSTTFTGPAGGTVIPAGFTVSLIYNVVTPVTKGEIEDAVSGEWFFIPPLGDKNQVSVTDKTVTPNQSTTVDVTGATINVLDVVPEPASVVMGTTSILIGLGYWWRRRKRALA